MRQQALHPSPTLDNDPRTWRRRVLEARRTELEKDRHAAYAHLVRDALLDYEVFIVAARPDRGPVDPAQYREHPVVNFDLHLEQKEYWPRAGGSGLLGERTGYCFSSSGRGFAILGPGAIEVKSPVLTRMHADHELFHARYHLHPTKSSDDRELEAWTDAFVSYFHRIYGALKKWKPLIDYYEGASQPAREEASSKLVQYYRSQPPNVKIAMLALLGRRQKDMSEKLLVKDLGLRWR